MMSNLGCPKCRQPFTDSELEAGSCPSCGFDGPAVVIGRLGNLWLFTVVFVLAGAGALGSYLLIPRGAEIRSSAHVGTIPKQHRPHPDPIPPPHQSAGPGPAPLPREIAIALPPEAPALEPEPVAVVPAKNGRPIVLDPREVPDHKLVVKLDHKLGTVAIPDLNGHDRIILSGRVKILKIGAVNGEAVIDASGLAADEIVVTGDINGRTIVKLNAPGGRISLGGLVIGSVRLTADVSGGEVILVGKSGRFGGSAIVAITARRVVIDGLANEGARVRITLTLGGYLKVASMDGGAQLSYKKAAATDPEPRIETGELRNGTKVELER